MVRLFLVVIVVIGLSVTLACGGGKPDVTSPPSVPAVPNDSIVTAEVIGITQVSNGFSWQISIRLLDSQDVAGYPNLTKSRVGEEILALTKEDASWLQVGQTITAHLELRGDEHGIIFRTWNISSQG